MKIGVGLLGDKILPLADIGPADRAGAVVGDEGRGITIIDQLAKTRPQMKNLNPGDFIDPSILKEIEDSE